MAQHRTHSNNSTLFKQTCMTCRLQPLNTRNFSLKVTLRLRASAEVGTTRTWFPRTLILKMKKLFIIFNMHLGNADIQEVDFRWRHCERGHFQVQWHFPAISHNKAITVRSAECCSWSIYFLSEMQNWEKCQNKQAQNCFHQDCPSAQRPDKVNLYLFYSVNSVARYRRCILK